MKKKTDLNYEAETEIIITTGASQGIDAAFRTILSPGDEVILPDRSIPDMNRLSSCAAQYR